MSEIDSLKSAASFWEFVGDVATVFVLLGVIGESVAEFDTLARWFGLLKRPLLRKRVERIGLLVLIVALAAEIPVSLRTHAINDKTTAILNGKLAVTSKVADTLLAANKNLEGAVNRQAIEIQRAGEQVNSLQVAERALFKNLDRDQAHIQAIDKWRVAVIDQLKPRDITKAQMARIAEQIRGHIGRIYLYPLSDPDSSRYVFALSEALKSGGADPRLILDTAQPGAPRFWDKFNDPVPIGGITIYEYPNGGEKGAANLIFHALSKVGIAAALVWPQQPFRDVPSLTIFVGVKSEPFLEPPSFADPPGLEKWLKKHPPPWSPN